MYLINWELGLRYDLSEIIISICVTTELHLISEIRKLITVHSLRFKQDYEGLLETVNTDYNKIRTRTK